jgi:hypothetical protein
MRVRGCEFSICKAVCLEGSPFAISIQLWQDHMMCEQWPALLSGTKPLLIWDFWGLLTAKLLIAEEGRDSMSNQQKSVIETRANQMNTTKKRIHKKSYERSWKSKAMHWLSYIVHTPDPTQNPSLNKPKFGWKRLRDWSSGTGTGWSGSHLYGIWAFIYSEWTSL